jgi:hypothetical protein
LPLYVEILTEILYVTLFNTIIEIARACVLNSSHVMIHMQEDAQNEEEAAVSILWAEQRLSLNNPKGHRWHPRVITYALGIFLKSRRAYDEMKSSGMVALPSGRTLLRYLNKYVLEEDVHVIP